MSKYCLIAILFIFTGCITETTTELATCELTVSTPETEVIAGEIVSLSGTPFTSVLDTSIRFDGVDADILSVEREDCSLCDQCRASAACTACETCEACATSCETCIETTEFSIPDLESGTYTVVLRNQYGQSIPAQWEVLQSSDNFDAPSEEPSL